MSKANKIKNNSKENVEIVEAVKNDKEDSKKAQASLKNAPDISNNNNSSNNIKQDSEIQVKTDKDRMGKDELIQRLNELEEKLRMEYEERKKILVTKNSQLEEKERIIVSFAKANKKLINEFDALKNEVDQRLDKVNIRSVTKVEKLSEEKLKNPLEIVLKVKERELKNTFQMMQIVKRDKELLEKKLEEKADYKRVVGLEDSLLNEERKNKNLQIEIKLLQQMLEDHNKKCVVKVNQSTEKERFNRDEIKLLKDKLKELSSKLKDEEEKHTETKQKYQEQRREYDRIKHLLPKDIQEKETKKEQENEDKDQEKVYVEDQKKLQAQVHKVNKSLSIKNPLYIDEVNKNRGLSGEKSPKSTRSQRKKLYPTEEKKLFSTADLQKLSKLISRTELEKFEKKFDYADHRGFSLERKYNSDFKIYNKKFNELEEQLEFVTLQLKEAEQRAKIFQFQIHEHKLETKSMSKKYHEAQTNIDVLQKLVLEKENENKSIINRLQECQSLNDIYKKKNGEMEIIIVDYKRRLENEHDEAEEGGDPEEET